MPPYFFGVLSVAVSFLSLLGRRQKSSRSVTTLTAFSFVARMQKSKEEQKAKEEDDKKEVVADDEKKFLADDEKEVLADDDRGTEKCRLDCGVEGGTEGMARRRVGGWRREGGREGKRERRKVGGRERGREGGREGSVCVGLWRDGETKREAENSGRWAGGRKDGGKKGKEGGGGEGRVRKNRG